jgi:hypothetical protein
MSGRAKNLLVFGASALLPPPTAFDGTYAGVSADVSKSRARGETLPARTPTGHIDDHERRGPFAGEGQVDRKREPARQRDTA